MNLKPDKEELERRNERDKADRLWSQEIAELLAVSLLNAGAIEATNYDRVVEILAEDLWVRLLTGDRPEHQSSQG